MNLFDGSDVIIKTPSGCTLSCTVDEVKLEKAAETPQEMIGREVIIRWDDVVVIGTVVKLTTKEGVKYGS